MIEARVFGCLGVVSSFVWPPVLCPAFTCVSQITASMKYCQGNILPVAGCICGAVSKLAFPAWSAAEQPHSTQTHLMPPGMHLEEQMHDTKEECMI